MLLKTTSYIAISAALGLTGAAAADLPSIKGPAVFAAPIFTWTGFYVGANLGGVWQRPIVDDLVNGYLTTRSHIASVSGVSGGLQAGYNWQFANIVLGVEADASLTSARTSQVARIWGGGFAPGMHNASMPAFGSIRARAGVAFDRVLPYITGGFAIANLSNRIVDTSLGNFTRGRSGTATGWTIGAGAEVAVTDHWTAKAEYLFAQFSDTSARLPPFYSFKFKDSVQTARVGLNYKF